MLIWRGLGTGRLTQLLQDSRRIAALEAAAARAHASPEAVDASVDGEPSGSADRGAERGAGPVRIAAVHRSS
jgi:hypothetical protein